MSTPLFFYTTPIVDVILLSVVCLLQVVSYTRPTRTSIGGGSFCRPENWNFLYRDVQCPSVLLCYFHKNTRTVETSRINQQRKIVGDFNHFGNQAASHFVATTAPQSRAIKYAHAYWKYTPQWRYQHPIHESTLDEGRDCVMAICKHGSHNDPTMQQKLDCGWAAMCIHLYDVEVDTPCMHTSYASCVLV